MGCKQQGGGGVGVGQERSEMEVCACVCTCKHMCVFHHLCLCTQSNRCAGGSRTERMQREGER